MEAISSSEFPVSNKEEPLNLFSLLSILAFSIYVYLGLYAFYLEPKARLNRILLVLSLDLALWAFAYAFVYSAPNKEVLWIWFKISAIGWCFIGGIGLHFMLILSQHADFLKKPWVYLLLYVPGLVFLFRAWTGILTARDFIPTPLGWVEVLAADSLWPWLHTVNYWSCLLIGVFLTFQWGKKSRFLREKKQARLIGSTIIALLILGTIINIIMPAMKLKTVPAIAQILILVWAYGIWQAIIKYRLLVFSAAIASDEILSRMNDLLILTSQEGWIIKINRQTEKLLGYREDELLGQPVQMIFQDREVFEEMRLRINADRFPMPERDVLCQTRNGELIPIKIYSSTVKDNSGDLMGLVFIGEDQRLLLRLKDEIFVRRRADDALLKVHEEQEHRIQERTRELSQANEALLQEIAERQEMEKLFKTLFFRAPIGSYILQDGKARIINPELMKTTGYSEDELLTLPALGLVHPEDREKVRNEAIAMLTGERQHPYEFRVVTKEGRIRWILETVTSIRYQGRPATLASFMDITYRKESEEMIRQMAYYDPLTGLPNRILLQDRFALALAKAERNQENLTLMIFDLDNFKDINDTLGHSCGDRLLKEVGQRLITFLRKSDTVARFGGDEFIGLLPETGQEEDVEKIAGKILEVIQKPFYIEDESIQITISIGLAFYPKNGQTLDLLMKNADQAMYRAKARGKNNFQYYDNLLN